ncbi:hypothetical protein HAX54_028931, partial [Datura stramonium]|nr:hypothetical protein [Datura stramonium]
VPDMSALDALKVVPSSVQGPIDEHFEGLRDDFAGLGDTSGGDAGEADADDEEE